MRRRSVPSQRDQLRAINWRQKTRANHATQSNPQRQAILLAKRTDRARSDIDPMVIGEDLTYSDLYAGLQAAEGVLNRPVNPNFLSIKDWRQKLSQKNSFVSKLSTQPKIFIFGGEMILNYEREGPR